VIQVSLDPSLEEFVSQKIRAGEFTNASELVNDAVRRIKEIDEDQNPELEALRRELQIGIDQLDRGEGIAWDLEEFKKRCRERLQARRESFAQVNRAGIFVGLA
jgi:antitoxin ParD1/3/4